MKIVVILAVLLMCFVLCIVEIPKMLHQKLYREMGTFIGLLGLGAVLAVLKTLDVEVPNPSDWLEWAYSPVKNVMKSLIK